MPIFISHSHQDKDFVDVLAANLILRKAHVWVDRWELKVGDSLIDKVQSAIKTASALIIVLSKASVASEWCKKELNAGLIRELEERRVVVLPVLREDCEIPLFLREKKYADFRKNFDAGLNEIHKAVSSILSDTQGRIERPEFHVDWGLSWGESDGGYYIHLRFISHGEQFPYCVLTEVKIICNDSLSQKFYSYRNKGIEWFGHLLIVSMLHLAIEKEGNATFILENTLPVHTQIHFLPTESSPYGVDAYISTVRLGSDTDMDTYVDWGRHIRELLEDLDKEVTPTDRETLRRELTR